MDAAQRRGTAINLAFLAPLTPFRHFVMGRDALERGATGAETMKIKALLREAATRSAVSAGLEALLGSPPIIFEPASCMDAGSYGMQSPGPAIAGTGCRSRRPASRQTGEA